MRIAKEEEIVKRRKQRRTVERRGEKFRDEEEEKESARVWRGCRGRKRKKSMKSKIKGTEKKQWRSEMEDKREKRID